MNTRAKRLLVAAMAAGGLLATASCGTAAGATDDTGSASPSPGLPTPTQTVAQKQVSQGAAKGRLVIFGLHRTGALATLDFGLVNETDKPVSTNSLLSRDVMEDDVSGVYLVDTSNQKKYLPARQQGECLCTNRLEHVSVGKGQTQYLTAVYAAPPSSVHAVDVSFPHFGMLKNVPVQ